MITTRVLPREEWGLLEGFDVGAYGAILPAHATVIVVEQDGQIVGCWSGVPTFHYHVEGLQIKPAFQKHARVALALLRAMQAHVTSEGVANVLTGCASSEVRGLLEHVGATKLPMDIYGWPLEDTCR